MYRINLLFNRAVKPNRLGLVGLTTQPDLVFKCSPECPGWRTEGFLHLTSESTDGLDASAVEFSNLQCTCKHVLKVRN